MTQTFTIYDAAKSNAIATAAYFPMSRTLAVEQLGDSHGDVRGIETDIRLIRLYAGFGDDVIRILKELFQTEYVEAQ